MAASLSSAANDQPEEDASELIFPKGSVILLHVTSVTILAVKLAVRLTEWCANWSFRTRICCLTRWCQ